MNAFSPKNIAEPKRVNSSIEQRSIANTEVAELEY